MIKYIMPKYHYGLALARWMAPEEITSRIRSAVFRGGLQFRILKVVYQPSIRRIDIRNGYYMALVFNPDEIPSENVFFYFRNFIQEIGLGSKVTPLDTDKRDQKEIETFMRASSAFNSFTDTMKPEDRSDSKTVSHWNEISESNEEITLPDLPADSWRDLKSGEPSQEAWDQFWGWASAAGSGSWPLWKKAVGVILGSKPYPYRVLRDLSLLGHLNFDQDSLSWSVTRSRVIIADPSDDYCFLAGQITPLTIAELRKKTEIRQFSRGDGPSTFYVDPAPSKRLEISTQSGPAILEVEKKGGSASLLELNAWEDLLPLIEVEDLLVSASRIYESVERFFSQQNRWDSCGADLHQINRPKGLYRFRQDGQVRFMAFYRGNGKWVVSDYSDMRYLAAVYSGNRPICRILSNGDLIVPSIQRLPIAYEKVLVQSTGQLPVPLQQIDGNLQALCFKGVPESQIKLLGSAIGLEILE